MTGTTGKTPIVIPLHHGGGKHGTDTELRFALRSLEAHLIGDFEVVIVGRKLPEWITGVRHLVAEGLKAALLTAANAYPDGFVWWYDDCNLLLPSTVSQLKTTPACRRWQKPKTGWSKKLDTIRARLEREGIKPWD